MTETARGSVITAGELAANWPEWEAKIKAGECNILTNEHAEIPSIYNVCKIEKQSDISYRPYRVTLTVDSKEEYVWGDYEFTITWRDQPAASLPAEGGAGFQPGDTCPRCGSTLTMSAYNEVICLKSGCRFDAVVEMELAALQTENAQLQRVVELDGQQIVDLRRELSEAKEDLATSGKIADVNTDIWQKQNSEIASLRRDKEEIRAEQIQDWKRAETAEALLRSIESCDYKPFENRADVLYSEITRWQEKIADTLEIEGGEQSSINIGSIVLITDKNDQKRGLHARVIRVENGGAHCLLEFEFPKVKSWYFDYQFDLSPVATEGGA